ncbi:MAG: DUF5631 domain-containing protein [Mycobacterium sp.]
MQSFFEDFARQLLGVRTGPLAPMEGVTADAVRDLFEKGEKQATAVSDKNGTKQKAFSDTADALNGLRSALSQIAAEGNAKINEINESKKNIAEKLAEIVQVISEKQAEAANKSTQFGGAITKSIGEVLSAEGDPRSAQQFAADSGFDLSNPPVPQSKESIQGLVSPMVKNSNEGLVDARANAAGGPPPGAHTSVTPTNAGSATEVLDRRNEGAVAAQPAGLSSASPADLPSRGPTDQMSALFTPQSVPGITTAAPDINLPGGGSLPGVPLGPGGGLPLPGAPGGGIATGMVPGLSHVPTTGIGAGLPDIGHALAPENLAQGFTHGLQPGTPLSAGAEGLSQAISHGAQNAIHPQVTQPPEFSTPTGTLSTPTIPSAGGAVPVEHASPMAATATAAPATPLSPTMFAPPAPAAPISATPMAAPPPMAPAGALPAYGADLRAATPTVSAPPPITPPSTAPTSAPISSSNPASGLSQPTVVSKAPGSATPANASPLGVTESAVAATASGAITGAATAQSAARTRLRRFVEAVARQEPRLRWAVGEREDGTTVLVTDLDSGWIPAGIEIPTGVTLLAPEHRHGGFEKLLRDAVIIETWSPGQLLPNDETEPVAMSLRARDLPTVDDLNWEITQATNWRDGLPRLAHTLTKAVVGGTGVLDTETDLLREHLRAISDKVCNAYPDSVDTQSVGTWQLLAAIDALVSGQKTALNYHFAWFRALHTAQQDR